MTFSTGSRFGQENLNKQINLKCSGVRVGDPDDL